MTIHYTQKEGIRNFFRFKGTVLTKIWFEMILFLVINIGCSVVVYIWDVLPAPPSWYVELVASGLGILGVYTTNVMYGRWWKLRYNVGLIMGKLNDMSVMFRAYIQAEANDTEAKKERVVYLKHRFFRFKNLSHGLCYWQAMGKPRKFLQRLIDYGLLSEGERELVYDFPNNAYLMAFAWTMDTLQDLKAEGVFVKKEFVFQMILENIANSRQGAYEVFQYLNTPFPLPYMHMYMVFLLMNITFMAVLLPAVFKESGVSPFFSVIIIFSIVFFYYGLLAIAQEIENPFDNDVNDFSTLSFLTSTTASSMGCVKTKSFTEEEYEEIEKSLEGPPSLLPVFEQLRALESNNEEALAQLIKESRETKAADDTGFGKRRKPVVRRTPGASDVQNSPGTTAAPPVLRSNRNATERPQNGGYRRNGGPQKSLENGIPKHINMAGVVTEPLKDSEGYQRQQGERGRSRTRTAPMSRSSSQDSVTSSRGASPEKQGDRLKRADRTQSEVSPSQLEKGVSPGQTQTARGKKHHGSADSPQPSADRQGPSRMSSRDDMTARASPRTRDKSPQAVSRQPSREGMAVKEGVVEKDRSPLDKKSPAVSRQSSGNGMASRKDESDNRATNHSAKRQTSKERLTPRTGEGSDDKS